MTTNGPKTTNAHPLQPIVNVSVAVIARLLGPCLFLLTLASGLLIIDSANRISPELGGAVTALAAFGLFVALAVISVNSSAGVFLIHGSLRHRLEPWTPLEVYAVVCGFVQTAMWVADPSKEIHEPRSVFIIAVAGALAFYQHQNRATQKP